MDASIWHIAGREIVENLRNRWLLYASGGTAAVVLGVAYFGTARLGSTGFTGLDLTLAGSFNFIVYIVPLAALLLGTGSVSEERDLGSLLAWAVACGRRNILIGKFLGCAAAAGAMILLGIYLPAVLSAAGAGAGAGAGVSTGMAGTGAAGSGDTGGRDLLVFTWLLYLLALAYTALGFLGAVLFRSRARALTAGIVIWLGTVIVYDVVLLGAWVALEGAFPALFELLVLLNPVDGFRAGVTAGIPSLAGIFGLSGLAAPGAWSPLSIGALLLAWTVAALAAGSWVFSRQDL